MSDRVPVARLLRTVRHVRPAQAVAQLRHLIAPRHRISRLAAPPPLAVERAAAPFLPPADHARVVAGDGGVRVRLIEREVGFRERVDWDHAAEGPLWAYHLHQFDHARHPDASPALRAALILDWIDSHPDGVGWDSHPTSHRILSWSKLLLTPGALALEADARDAVRLSLASQVETLSHNLEERLQANHLFTNLLAVAFGGLLFEGPEADHWLGHADTFLAELGEQVHGDGAHEERSPMYHAVLLEQLLDLLNLAQASPRAPRGLAPALRETATRMLGALALWTHPDGEIALFADAALGIAASPAVLHGYGSSLGLDVPPEAEAAPAGGYVRLRSERLSLLVSVAGPSPEHMPGHAHCDALAFELCVDGERAVVDPGVYEYVPGLLRDAARATHSHATLEIDGREQAELWAAHRIGGRPHVRLLEQTSGICEATCEAWGANGSLHRRRFELDGATLRIRDFVEGGPKPVRIALPLAPGADARLVGGSPDATRLALRLAAGTELRVELPRGVAWRLEVRDVFPRFGRRVRSFCLVGESPAFAEGDWHFQPA